MRGLNIRVAYSMSKVIALHDPELSAQTALQASMDAEIEGYSDYMAGETSVPIMFMDETPLARSWRRGFSFGESIDISQDCAYCRNNYLNPCHAHG